MMVAVAYESGHLARDFEKLVADGRWSIKESQLCIESIFCV